MTRHFRIYAKVSLVDDDTEYTILVKSMPVYFEPGDVTQPSDDEMLDWVREHLIDEGSRYLHSPLDEIVSLRWTEV